jgi:hypothetical protein
MFGDESTYELFGHVHRQNVGIGRSKNQRAVVEGTRDSLTFSILWHCTTTKVFCPFRFAKCTVTGVVYVDTYDEFLLPIFIEGDPNGMQLQQEGALPNFHIAVRAGLIA